MRARRLIVIVVILIALAAAACMGGGQLAANLVRQGQVAGPTPGATAARPRLRAQGEVVPARWAELGFASGGVLAEVPVTAGQQVRAGDVLARLSTKDLDLAVRAAGDAVTMHQATLDHLHEPPDPTTIAAARAELEAAEAALEALQAGPTAADLAAAQADVAAAEADLARLRAVPDPAAVAQAQAQLDKAAVALQQAQTAYDQIQTRPDVAMSSQSLTLQQATIDHEAARAALALAGRKATAHELQAAEAHLAAVEVRLAATREGPSAADLAAAASRVRSAESTLGQAQETTSEADLAAARASLSEAEMRLARANADLETAILRAPFAGTVMALDAAAGQMVTNSLFLTLADLDWQVETVDVDEWVATRIVPGQAVELSFPAFDGEKLAGTVQSIAVRAKRAGAGADPFYAVVVTLDREQSGQPPALVAALRWGMTVRLDFGEE